METDDEVAHDAGTLKTVWRRRSVQGGGCHGERVRMAYRSRIRPVAWISLVVFVASVIAAVVYLNHDRPKHGGAFIALAVIAAVVLYFTATPRSRAD